MPVFLYGLLFLTLFGCHQPDEHPAPIKDYNFPMPDGEITRLHQTNDTLEMLKCYASKPCVPTPAQRYTIIAATRLGVFKILHLQSMDMEASSITEDPADRYSIYVLKEMDEQQLGVSLFKSGLTRKELDAIDVNEPSLNDLFFFTYFSNAYLDQLTQLKSPATEAEAVEIMELAKSDHFKALLQHYEKTNTADMYGAGITAEMMNQVCIQLGYNPCGIGRILRNIAGK